MKKKLVEGPLGFPLADPIAKAVDALLKRLPKECTYRKASYAPEAVEFVQGERADISMVSAESMDRDGEIVLAKGVDLTLFRQAPIVTFAHKYDELPVGKCQWIKEVVGGLKAKTLYSTRPDDWQGPWLPDAIFALTQQGVLKGKSIGFLPTYIRSPTQEEVGRNPQWKNARAVIESCVLLEYAVAPIPVNQDALVEAVAKGAADRASLERLGLALPKSTTRSKPTSKLEAHRKTLEKITLDPDRIAGIVTTILSGRGQV